MATNSTLNQNLIEQTQLAKLMMQSKDTWQQGLEKVTADKIRNNEAVWINPVTGKAGTINDTEEIKTGGYVTWGTPTSVIGTGHHYSKDRVLPAQERLEKIKRYNTTLETLQKTGTPDDYIACLKEMLEYIGRC